MRLFKSAIAEFDRTVCRGDAKGPANSGTMLAVQRSKQNRIHLYALRPGGEPGEFQSIASANGFLPSLWQVLLADGTPTPDLQRILHSHATTWIATSVASAVTRFDAFADFVGCHPDIAHVDALVRYFAATRTFLAEIDAAWQAAGQQAPLLCANLQQVALPDAPDQYQALQQFRDLLDRIMQSGDFKAIDTLLRFPTRNLCFKDWRAWSGMFGLAQFEPTYFSAAFREPFAGDYVDHDYDEFGSDADLGKHCYRRKTNGYWGVVRVAGDCETTIIEPRFDRVLRVGADAHSRVWLQQRAKFGLATIDGADAGSLLHDITLQQVSGFSNGVAVVRHEDRMGLLDEDGRWRLPPSMEEIHAFANGHAVIRADGKFGYINGAAEVVIAPTFDEADDFTTAGVARVRTKHRCGLVRADGSFARPLEFDFLEWSHDFAGWLGQRDGQTWLMRADGAAWIDGCDDIEIFIPSELIRVQRGALYGLVRWSGEVCLPCEFEELRPRDTAASGSISAQRRKRHTDVHFRATSETSTRPLKIIAHRDGLAGMLDASGTQLIPFQFARIDALEAHVEGEHQLSKPQLMRVLSVAGQAAPRVGIWDIERGECIVPCLYDFAWLTLLGVDDTYGFIVGNRNPKRGFSAQGRYRVGLLRADGSVLVPQEYAWIGERTPLNRDDAMRDIRNTLYHCWSAGEPVRASVNENGPIVAVPPPVTAGAPQFADAPSEKTAID